MPEQDEDLKLLLELLVSRYCSFLTDLKQENALLTDVEVSIIEELLLEKQQLLSKLNELTKEQKILFEHLHGVCTNTDVTNLLLKKPLIEKEIGFFISKLQLVLNFLGMSIKDENNIPVYITEKIMNDLKKTQTKLLVTFKNSLEMDKSSDQAVSHILDIDVKNRSFILDKFSSCEMHERAISGEKFLVETNRKGVSVFFYTHVLPEKEDEHQNYYKAAFPEELKYYQKRDAFRLKLYHTSKVNIKTKTGSFIGKIIDFSHTGCGLIVRSDITEIVKPMEIIKLCSFTIYEGLVITCSFEVRYILYNKEKDFTRIGCRFLDLDQKQRQVIEKIISKLQLEQLQKGIKIDG